MNVTEPNNGDKNSNNNQPSENQREDPFPTSSSTQKSGGTQRTQNESQSSSSILLDANIRFNQSQRYFVYYQFLSSSRFTRNSYVKEKLFNYDNKHADKLGQVQNWNKQSESDLNQHWKERILDFKRNIVEIITQFQYKFLSKIEDEDMEFIQTEDFTEGKFGKFMKQTQQKPYCIGITLHVPPIFELDDTLFDALANLKQEDSMLSSLEFIQNISSGSHITVTTRITDFKSQIEEIIPFCSLLSFKSKGIFFGVHPENQICCRSNVAILNDFLITDILYTIDQHIISLLYLTDFHVYLRYGKKEVNSISLEQHRFSQRISQSLSEIHRAYLHQLSTRFDYISIE